MVSMAVQKSARSRGLLSACSKKRIVLTCSVVNGCICPTARPRFQGTFSKFKPALSISLFLLSFSVFFISSLRWDRFYPYYTKIEY